MLLQRPRVVVVVVELVHVPQRTGHVTRRREAIRVWPGVALAVQSGVAQPPAMHSTGSAMPAQYTDVEVDELALVEVDDV